MQNEATTPILRALHYSFIACFGAMICLAFTKNVNWDEFYFLSHVHAFADGRLDRPLQTFFVRGFTWLTVVPGHEMEQILAARLVMIGCVGATVFSIYHIAQHLTDPTAGKVAVLAFLTSGFALPHAASFRADPIAAACLVGAIALIMTTQMRLVHIIFTAVLSALATLVTIKSALFAPVYVAALVWRWGDRGVVLRTLLSGVGTVVLIALLFHWHSSGLEVAPRNEAGANVRNAAAMGVLTSGWLPRSDTVALWALLSFVPIILWVKGISTQKSIVRLILLIVMSAPILSVLIYRNAFPYFFPFAIPPLMIAVAYGAQQIERRAVLNTLVSAMLLSGALQFAVSLTEKKVVQRATIAEVHRLFANPVPYIDDTSMIASFPSVGPFLSSWGLRNYQAEGRPVFSIAISEDKPPLLIANKWAMMSVMNNPNSRLLLPEDLEAIENTFVHYSGPIWLAGYQGTLANSDLRIVLPYEGTYQLISAGPISIDGVVYEDGQDVEVQHQVTLSGDEGTDFKLLWSTGVPLYSDTLETDGVFSDFWSLKRWVLP